MPDMLPTLGRPPTFHLTAETPSSVTDTTPRQTLSVHDLDGADREWTIESSVAKVSIFNSQNLTLRLPGRILTSTVEVFKCRNIRLIIGRSSDSNGDDEEEVQPLGILQLDPPLENVAIEYTSPRHIGKIVVAPLASQNEQGRPTFGFTNLSVRARGGAADATTLFDADGALLFPATEGAERPVMIMPGVGGFDLARQLVVSHEAEKGWQIAGLERGEEDYPVLG
ncbi:hypothetical protein JCM10908_003195 [Rhodotorula pacifica]|uniref:uncharacterized protein n=1 Tax=Rhodotorula pacifica TaxID=1495444 RepID=UPI0031803673